MKMIELLFLGALLVGAGCSDSKDTSQVDASGQTPEEPTIISIENESREVTLSLTDHYVSMQLSEAALKEIGDEFAEAREEKSSSQMVDRIKNSVLDRVENLLNRHLEYPIANIDRITWDNGEMVFTLNSERQAWDTIWIGDNSVLETFKEDDALGFIEAFENLKASGE